MMGYKSNKKDVEKALAKGYKQALIKIGVHAQGQASLLAPKDTGRLQGSITYIAENFVGDLNYANGNPNPKDRPKGKLPSKTLHVGSNVKYAPFQEKLNPFLKPTIIRNKRKYEDLVNKEIEGALK